jgi:hypothetical protein
MQVPRGKMSMTSVFVVHGRLQAWSARRYPFVAVSMRGNQQQQQQFDLNVLESLMKNNLIDLVLADQVGQQQQEAIAALASRYLEDPSALFCSDTTTTTSSNAHCGLLLKSATKLANLRDEHAGRALACELRELTIEAANECCDKADLLIWRHSPASAAAVGGDPFALKGPLETIMEKAVSKVQKPVLVEAESGLSVAEMQRVIQTSCAGVALPLSSFIGKRAAPEELAAKVKEVMVTASIRAKRSDDRAPRAFEAKKLPDKWAKLLQRKEPKQSPPSLL